MQDKGNKRRKNKKTNGNSNHQAETEIQVDQSDHVEQNEPNEHIGQREPTEYITDMSRKEGSIVDLKGEQMNSNDIDKKQILIEKIQNELKDQKKESNNLENKVASIKEDVIENNNKSSTKNISLNSELNNDSHKEVKDSKQEEKNVPVEYMPISSIPVAQHYSETRNIKEKIEIYENKLSEKKEDFITPQKKTDSKREYDDTGSVENCLTFGKNDVTPNKNGSKMSSVNDLLMVTRESNAKRIQTQIAELDNNALEYTKSLVQLYRDFNKIIKKIHNPENTIFYYIFSILGLPQRINLKSSLFIYCIQAWVMDLCSLLDSKLKTLSENGRTFKYSDILKIIKENELYKGVSASRELLYLNNYGIFTGNLSIERQSSPSFSLIENNLGKYFIDALSNLIVNELAFEEDLDKSEFEDILFSFFKKAIDRTLNTEMQSEIVVDFYATYEKFKLSEKENLTFENYFELSKENYLDKLNREFANAFELNELKICCNSYYDVAESNLQEIVEGIEIFIKNYSSIIFKLKRLFNQGLIKYKEVSSGLVNKSDIFVRNVTNILNKITNKDKLINTSLGMGKYMIKQSAKVAKRSNEALTNFKSWISNSICNLMNREAFMIKPIIILNTNLYKGVSYTLEKSNEYAKLSLDMGQHKFEDTKNAIENLFKRVYDKTSSAIGKLLYIEEDTSKKRVEIMIKKDLILISPLKFMNIYHALCNFYTNSSEIIHKTTKTIQQEIYKNIQTQKIKNFVLSKYKHFLGQEDSAEVKTIEMTTVSN